MALTRGRRVLTSIVCCLAVLNLSLEPVWAASHDTDGGDSEDEVVEVTPEDLGMCSTKIAKMSGAFGVICRQILQSPDFRATCATIPKEDRLQCDGSEPNVGNNSIADAKALAKCLPSIAKGLKDGAIDTAKDAWNSARDAAELGWSAAKSAAKAASWIFSVGSANAATVNEEKTSKSSSQTSSSSATRAPASSQSGSVTLTDDPAAYAAHAAVDEEEQIDWIALMTTKDFWIAFKDEMQIWLTSEMHGFLCLNPEKQNEFVCEVLGSGVGLKLLASGARNLLRKTASARSQFRKELVKIGKSEAKKIASKFSRAPAKAAKQK